MIRTAPPRGRYFLLLLLVLFGLVLYQNWKWSTQTGHSENTETDSTSVKLTETVVHPSADSATSRHASSTNPASVRESLVTQDYPTTFTEPVTVHRNSFKTSPSRCNEELGLVNSSFKLTQTEINEALAEAPVIVHSSSFKLPQKVVDGVEKFLFYIGWPRSGHTIIAVMLDAHPNIIIGRHGFLLFWDNHPTNRKLLNKDADSKEYLFSELYYSSVLSSSKEFLLADAGGGYDFEMNGTCQGRFTQLKVIGVKEGGWISTAYSYNPKRIQQYYHTLVNVTQIPVRVLFVIRNPYDMIATALRWSCGPHCDRKHKIEASKDHPYNDSVGLMREARRIFQLAEATQNMMRTCNLNTLNIYNEDFIEDPKHTIQQICNFLEVECSTEFLKQCQSKTTRSVSRSRNTVVWSEHVLRLVEKEIKKYPFFHRYSFHDLDAA